MKSGHHVLPQAFFHQIPKAELHCHLDGSVRLQTLSTLVGDTSRFVPVRFGQAHASLVQYLEQFDLICSALQTKEAIFRAAFELVEDAALENVWHIEIRFCPTLLTGQGLKTEEVVQAALDGANEAASRFNTSFGLILCGIKSFDPSKNLEIARIAAQFKDKGVVAFDLAGPEAGFPAKKHADSFVHVMNNYMHATVRAGEAYGPESIEQALTYCGAHRIGHGTRIFERPDLLAYVINRRIPLEVCPTSNEQTGVVQSVSKHPLREYLKAGVRVTINTDNRLVSNTTLTREYERVHRELDMGYEDIKKLVLNGFKSAFVPLSQKSAMLARVNTELAKIEKEFAL